MSESDFQGIELALGSVQGYRSWRVEVDGKLKALHQTGLWMPGENKAECLAYPNKDVVPEIEGEDWRDTKKRREAWRADHQMIDCAHGFYAYFNASQLETNAPSIHGVVEGYGEVLIGTKGFRATRARIIALCLESFSGIWNLDPFVVKKIRANYPSAAFFDSTFAMQEEFPADSAVESALA